jgi:aspartate oxidase
MGDKRPDAAPPPPEGAVEADIDAEARIIELKGIMVKYCGILRDGENLGLGLARVDEMLSELENARLRTIREIELYNMASVARAILESARRRKISVGSHFRTDEEE